MEETGVFKALSQDRVPRCRPCRNAFLSGLWSRSLSLLQQNAFSERIVEQIAAGGDFPSRRAGPRVVLPRQGSAAAGAEQLADIVSWPDHVDEHLPESAEWVLFRATATDRPFYWNRRTNATAWKPPPGINVVWVGEKPEGGGVWYWHKGTRASTYDLPSLPPE